MNITESATKKISALQEQGIDPTNYSWVETELAISTTEKRWFQFQRESDASLSGMWEQQASIFNNKFSEQIDIKTAIELTRKWKRYLIGAWFTIASKNTNISDWKTAARKFEKYHKEIENRMTEWTEKNKHDFPIAKTKEIVQFWHGPYFNECIEQVPHIFTNMNCSNIKKEIPLRIISFDTQTRFIRLDFTQDVRTKIKGSDERNPWDLSTADYSIRILPTEIETHLQVIHGTI